MRRVFEPPKKPAGWFPTTHWSAVLAAADGPAVQSAEALEQLCQAYWFPLYAFARREASKPSGWAFASLRSRCNLSEE